MMPQQALFALNSPFAIAQSKALIARTEIASHADPAERIGAMYRIVLLRDPNPEERLAALDFVTAPAAPESTLSIWEQFAQVLLASNELMYVD
jgi:hypothetical protein